MKYFVLTSKHHDGVALFHSKADRFNVVDATPFGRDVVGEIAEACYKYGLKFGLYYSQELDWHHPHGGGYDNPNGCCGVSWDNSWDFQDREHKDFSICKEVLAKGVKQASKAHYMTANGECCDTIEQFRKKFVSIIIDIHFFSCYNFHK